MPLYWKIDSKSQLIMITGEGDIQMTDATGLIDAISGTKTTHYRKVFDGRNATTQMSADEVLAIGSKIRSQHAEGTMGALAVIAKPEQTVAYARLLGVLAAAPRPIKVFDNPRQAQNWIEAQSHP